MSLCDVFNRKDFLLGMEIVSTRGTAAEESARKVLDFGHAMARRPDVDWLSVTDNAGGNPTLAPEYLGEVFLKEGAEVLVHLSAKDMNRNGLESRLWLLASRGLRNVLALTGDYPVDGAAGVSRPVFDLDSVSLLTLLARMNAGLAANARGAATRLAPTEFCCGAVVSPFKKLEAELRGQYLKLARKLEAGARFVITQVGYDARKWDELRHYVNAQGWDTPLVGYVYLLNRGVARLFHRGMIAGCVVSDALLAQAEKYGAGPDRGAAYFAEFAAKQIAVLRGLGYRGVYLGGLVREEQLERIFAVAASFGPDDWRGFAREIQYPQNDEFYLYARDAHSGLADPDRPAPEGRRGASLAARASYGFSALWHDWVFTPGRRLFRIAAACYRFIEKHSWLNRCAYTAESLSKKALFSCRDCGDCSLDDVAYLCPESQCRKGQRNGPCGGSAAGECESCKRQCIWVRAYHRTRGGEKFAALFRRSPVFVDERLRETSSWANTFLGRDHTTGPGKDGEQKRD